MMTTEVTTAKLQAARRTRPQHLREYLLFLAFVGPNLILFGLFQFWPLIQSVYISTTRWDMIAPVKKPIGLANYQYFVDNATFHRVLRNTVVFTTGPVGGTLFLGLVVALLLNQPLRGRDAGRAVVFALTLLSGAAISVIWVYIFDPRFGLFATILKVVGISSPNWLRDPYWAMPAVLIVYIWKNLGFVAVIFLAGFQAIPKDLYEAAEIDGAGPFWRFRTVTLPMLSPITFFVTLTSVLGAFQSFDIIQAMTEGGPVNSTNNLLYYIYQQGFVAFNAGRASAAAVMLFAVMLVITLVQMRLQEKNVHYGN